MNADHAIPAPHSNERSAELTPEGERSARTARRLEDFLNQNDAIRTFGTEQIVNWIDQNHDHHTSPGRVIPLYAADTPRAGKRLICFTTYEDRVIVNRYGLISSESDSDMITECPLSELYFELNFEQLHQAGEIIHGYLFNLAAGRLFGLFPYRGEFTQ